MNKTVGIDLPYLSRLARNSTYNWMVSLRAIRVFHVQNKRARGCRSCPRPEKQLTPEIVQAVITDRRFIPDLRQFKQWVKADKLIVNVGSVRCVL